MLQHGAYNLIIDACYDREKFPSLADAMDWAWASTSEEEQAVKFVLGKFFVENEGVFVQKRIEETLADYHAKAVTNKKTAIEREARNRENKEKRSRESTKRDEKSTKRDEKSTKRDEDVNTLSPNHKPLTTNQEPLTKNHKPRTINKTKTPSDKSDTSNKKYAEDVQDIFNYWVDIMGKSPQAKITPKRSGKIIDRLKDGYSVEFIKSAIDGCSKSGYHMGQNNGGTVYDDLELICRSGEKLENFGANIGKVTPISAGQPESIDDFRERVRRTTQDAINSGFLDDIPD